MSDIAGLVAVTIHAEQMVVIMQIFFGQGQHGFFLKGLNESLTQVEEQISDQVILIGDGDLGGVLGILEAQFTFVAAFVEIADGGTGQ